MKRALSWRTDYYFDREEAARAVQFFEHELVHIKGDCAGQHFKLQPWQRRIVRRVFGWKSKKTKTRKHRRVWIEVPKGNGKSPIASGFALYLFAADKEPGAEVICAAADREQAGIVYDFAKENVLRNSKLKRLVGTPYRRSMAIRSTVSSLQVVSSEAKSKHGSKLHGLILDEVHAISDREYIETLLSGTAKRPRSLTVMLTTAGYDRMSMAYQFHDHARKVLAGIIEDPELFPVIFSADSTDDWKAPATWKKANPNFNITMMETDLAAQCRMAEQMPSMENSFKRLFLNIWTEQDVRWFPMPLWDAGKREINEAELEGKECYIGLDLASNDDIAAAVLAFNLEHEDGDLIYLHPIFWVGKEAALKRQKRHQVPYDDWMRGGFIRGNEGSSINFDIIRRDFKVLAEKYAILEIGMDKLFNGAQLAQQLTDDGLTVVGCGQGMSSLSAASKHLELLLMQGKLLHSGHPVLRWMASNVAVETDAAANIKPSKKKSREKIDGIIASVMAIGRMIVADGERGSVYEERGLITL